MLYVLSNLKVECGDDVDLELIRAKRCQPKQMSNEMKPIRLLSRSAVIALRRYARCCKIEEIIIHENDVAPSQSVTVL